MPNPNFQAGSKAYEEGKPLSDNPHTFNSFEHNQWLNGWTHAEQVATDAGIDDVDTDEEG